MEPQSLYFVITTLCCIVASLFLFRRKLFSWIFGHRKVGTPYGSTAQTSSFTLQRAYGSFRGYPNIVASEASSYHSKLNTLRGGHRRIALELGYSSKIQALRRCNSVNTIITKAICEVASLDFPELDDINLKDLSVDVGRVRESLKHLVRDWSEEGAQERGAIFEPILTQLEKVPRSSRASYRILVPGAGLGRLAWEISMRGFNTTSCELSFYMNLSLRFLLSPLHTKTINQHRLSPFSNWWSHQRSNESTFREVAFPDVVPRRHKDWTILEADFLGLSPSSDDSQSSGEYDMIVTLYFIDTASNIITYLKHIHYLLKPGGKWINLGPLLYSNAVLELSLQEVLKAMDLVGFEIDPLSRMTIPSEYTADKEAMMKWVYQAEFWIATKRLDAFVSSSC